MRNSSKFSAVSIALGIGAAIAARPGTAGALTCAAPGGLAPRQGSLNVPTDTLLWGFLGSSTRLLGPSGEVVPLDEHTFDVTGAPVIGGKPFPIPVLVPRSVLEPSTEYTIEITYGTEDAPELIEFVTGQGPTNAPPAAPVLLSAEPQMSEGAFISPNRSLQLQFETDGILIGDATGLGPVGSVEDLFIEDPSLAQKTNLERPRLTWATMGDNLSVGVGDCITWPEGAADTQNARFATFDLAGNISSWVDVELQLPSLTEAQAVLGLEPSNQPSGTPMDGSSASSCGLTAAGTPVPLRGAGMLTISSLGILLALGARRRRR